MLCSLIAAALTFTATATGVEKGTAVEFFFAGKNTDRDYETMFLLDESIDWLLIVSLVSACVSKELSICE